MPEGPEFDPQADLTDQRWRILHDEASLGIYHIDTADGAHQIGEVYGRENAEAVALLPEDRRRLRQAYTILACWEQTPPTTPIAQTSGLLRDEMWELVRSKPLREKIVDRGNGPGED